MKNATKSSNDSRFQKLIDNNKIVFLISIAAAFIVWVAVAMYASPDEKTTISVPISIDMENGVISKNSYQIFGTYNNTVDITVSGPRYLISKLKPEDISAVAKTNDVDGAGISNLPIKATVLSNSDEVSIVDMSVSSVTVYFDTLESKKFDVEVDKSKLSESVASDYFIHDVTPLTTSVTLSGPKTEIDKVNRVVAAPESDGTLTKSQTVDTVVSLEGSRAVDTVSINEYIHFEETVKVKISVWQNEEIPLSVKIDGSADGIGYTINPSTAKFGIDTEQADSIKNIVIASVSASDIKDGDTMTVKASSVTASEYYAFENPDASFEITFTNSNESQ